MSKVPVESPVESKAVFQNEDAVPRHRQPLLQVSGLNVRLGPLPVLHDLSFTVGAGERVGIIGESGSGKSVTALAVLGLLPEEMTASGDIRLDGEDLLGASERRLSQLRGNRVSMVFQEPMSALNPLMRVGKQVAEVLRVHRGLSRRAARARAVELLTRVGLDQPAAQARAFPHQLSGGQRQRAMLAIAIACGPALILADEPTTALDVTVQARVLALLDQLVTADGAALVLISHDLAVVSAACEQLLVMYGGRIVEAGPTGALLGDPRHPYTAGLVATSAAVSPDHGRDGRALPAIAGTVPELGAFGDGCVFRSRCARATEACEQAPPLTGGAHRFACWHPVAAGEAAHGNAGSANTGPRNTGPANSGPGSSAPVSAATAPLAGDGTGRGADER
jgi:peptide/nickel transport system ATP-binding protein